MLLSKIPWLQVVERLYVAMRHSGRLLGYTPLRIDGLWGKNYEKPITTFEGLTDFIVPFLGSHDVLSAIKGVDVVVGEALCESISKGQIF